MEQWSYFLNISNFINFLFFLFIQLELGDLIGQVSGQDENSTCTFLSADRKICYFFRAESFTFDSAVSYCEKEFNATLISTIPSLDEESILQTANLPFWIGVKGKLTWNLRDGKEGGRVFIHNEWINQRNFTQNRWDYSTLNLSHYWYDHYFCAEAVKSEEEDDTFLIRWKPENCEKKSQNTLCAKPFQIEDPSIEQENITFTTEIKTESSEVTNLQEEATVDSIEDKSLYSDNIKSTNNLTLTGQTINDHDQGSSKALLYIFKYSRELMMAVIWALILLFFIALAIVALSIFYRRKKWLTHAHKTSSTLTYIADESVNKSISLIQIRNFSQQNNQRFNSNSNFLNH